MNDSLEVQSAVTSCLKYDANKRLYVCNVSGSIQVFNNRIFDSAAQPHSKGINDISVAREFVATASDDTFVAVTAPLQENVTVTRHSEHNAPVTCVTALHPSASHLVASGGFDENIVVYDISAERLLTRLYAHADPVTDIAVDAGSRLMASSSYDGLVRLWDGQSGRLLRTVIGETNPPATGVVFSGNKELAAAYLDGSVRVWDMRTGKQRLSFSKHLNSAYIIRPAIVGGILLMGSEDGKLFEYPLDGERLPSCHQVSTSAVINFACTENGDEVAINTLESSKITFIKLS